MNNGIHRHREFTSQDISKVLARYRASGLGARRFAREQGIPPWPDALLDLSERASEASRVVAAFGWRAPVPGGQGCDDALAGCPLGRGGEFTSRGRRPV